MRRLCLQYDAAMRRLLLFLFLFLSSPGYAEKISYSSRLALGYGYDTNVLVDDVDLATEQGDQFTDLSLAGGLEKDFGDSITVTADIALSSKQYRTFDDFDGQLALASFSLQKKLSSVDLGLTVRHVDYQLDGEGFLHFTQAGPSVSWFPSKTIFIRGAYEYSDETFDDEMSRNNHQHKASLRSYWFLRGLKQYVLLHFQHSRDEAADFSFDNHSSEVSLRYRQEIALWARDVTVEIGFRYQERDYRKFDETLDAHREDRRRRLDLSLEWPLTDKTSLECRISSSDYRSNLESADYKQNVYALTLKYEL